MMAGCQQVRYVSVCLSVCWKSTLGSIQNLGVSDLNGAASHKFMITKFFNKISGKDLQASQLIRHIGSALLAPHFISQPMNRTPRSGKEKLWRKHFFNNKKEEWRIRNKKMFKAKKENQGKKNSHFSCCDIWNVQNVHVFSIHDG